jgi:chemotaxis protein CheX
MGGILNMAQLAPAAPKVFQLAEVLDLKAAVPLRNALMAVRGAPVQLDASSVQRLGGLCLQVLMSARQTWLLDGAMLRIINPSPEFTDGLALFGAASLSEETGASS